MVKILPDSVKSHRKYALLTNTDLLAVFHEKHRSLSARLEIPPLLDNQVDRYEQVVYQMWGSYHPIIGAILPRWADCEEVGLMAQYFVDGSSRWAAFSSQWINGEWLIADIKYGIQPGTYTLHISKEEDTTSFEILDENGSIIISSEAPQAEEGKLCFELGMEHYSESKKWRVKPSPVKFSHIYFDNFDGWNKKHLSFTTNMYLPQIVMNALGDKHPSIRNIGIENYGDYKSWVFNTG